MLLEKVSWLEPEMLDSFRLWRGTRPETPFLKWASVREECHRAGLKGIFGKFNGQPGRPDAHMARLALLLLASSGQPPKAVLLVRDSDGDSRRRLGLEQARNDNPWPFPVIIGVAEPKKNDAKVALEELTQGDKQRERACLEETPLAVLEARGGKTGLAEYLKEVRERLISVL